MNYATLIGKYSIYIFLFFVKNGYSLSKKDIKNYRDQVESMFYHAYDGYIKYAYPYDELRPLTCDGHDTWGSYSLTLIDALDTLAVLGNKTEFQRVAELVAKQSNFDIDINVSVFETNIRILGGLLSAHLMSKRMDLAVGNKWPCEGPLLKLAEDVANRLLPAFDTPTGLPYGTVNLRKGVPRGETPITCTAGVATYAVEFGTLSRLTNNPLYEDIAVRAMHSVWQHKSSINLVGNHIDVLTGRWTAQDAGIGAGVDSYYEYLVKGSFLLKRPELLAIFHESRKAIEKYLRHDDWYLWGTMNKGHITMAVFQSLEAFWPGVLSLIGDLSSAQKTIYNYHHVWKQFGFTPEFYNIPQSDAAPNREGYPLRPELAESLVYMFQATGDHSFLEMGADIITSILHSAKTSCGFATIKNVNDHSLDNRMESFFLAETTKYLYLLFDHEHWLHNKGNHGKYHEVGNRACIIDAGGYIYNTEAHPIDPGALDCCSGPEKSEMFFDQKELINLILDPTISLSKHRGQHSSASVKKVQYPNVNEIRKTDDLDTNIDNSNAQYDSIDKDASCNEETLEDHNDRDSETVQNKEVLNQAIVKLNTNSDKVPRLFLSKDVLSSTASKQEGSATLFNSETEEKEEELKDSNEEHTPHMNGLTSKNVESKMSNSIQLERQNIDKNTTEMETSDITTSVSSSKYSLNMAQMAASRLLLAQDTKLNLQKPRRNKIFNLDNLKDRLKLDLETYSNFTNSVSHHILSCPHPSFTNMLNYKGQMFYP